MTEALTAIEHINLINDAMAFIEEGRTYRAYATLDKLLEDCLIRTGWCLENE